MRSGDDIDTSICPLCGESNHCVMADSHYTSDEPCWCKSEKLPPELRDKLPKGAKNRACICRQCLQKT